MAVAQFHDWRGKIDADGDNEKPNAPQYHEAIGLREAMKHWLEMERDNADQFDDEQAQRRQNHADEFERKHTADARYDADYLSYADEYNRLAKELARLNKDFARTKPPRLNEAGRLPVNPLAYRSYAEQMVWSERLDILKAHQKWTGTTPDKSLFKHIDQFLESKSQQADAGQFPLGGVVLFANKPNTSAVLLAKPM